MSELPKRVRRTVAAPQQEMSFLSEMTDSEEEEEMDEWKPAEKAPPKKRQAKAPKEPAKKRVAKPKAAAAPKPRKTAAKKTSKIPKAAKVETELICENNNDVSDVKETAGPKIKEERRSISVEQSTMQKISTKTDVKKKTPRKSAPKAVKVKAERKSLGIDEFPSTSTQDIKIKRERMSEEEPSDDFTFGGPPTKKTKMSADGTEMNWDIVEVCAERTNIEPWVCANLIHLFKDDNTIPFIARYRKELINNHDADALREVQQTIEELRSVAKKAHNLIEKLKKEGKMNGFLNTSMLNCRTMDEIEHVYAPYKTGSKGTKAQRARQLGLETAAKALLETPKDLNLFSYMKKDTEGLLTLQEIETGVQHILADMIAKDKDSLEHIRNLCKQNYVTINSTLAKATGKEKEGNVKDVDKFHLYHNFTCSVFRIQHHQILAINRGENLKVLTVKVNVPDRVKDAFCRWCVNERWRPKQFAKPEFMKILHSSVEDSYKRLIFPLLCREFRSKLTSDAEKESIMMFGRNLRQLLLASPVRGRTIMGVDPGYKHGCKLAIISPTNQILHTDVVYLHMGRNDGMRDAEKIRGLLLKFNCFTVAIGNGTACRETERYFADLIQRKFFAPLNVVYCITNEAGASIYSVSPEASKEMPDLDPNLRSAGGKFGEAITFHLADEYRPAMQKMLGLCFRYSGCGPRRATDNYTRGYQEVPRLGGLLGRVCPVSIARRVQDPLAELVKIEPKHIGVGMYQHDVSQVLLKGTLDSVVEECVSFVGVDINMCSETLLRHIAGLNSVRAKNVVEWREKNGPFLNREQLKSVKGLGPKTFQQCAGFIRINQDYVRNLGRDQEAGQNVDIAGSSKPASKPTKKTAKSAANIPARPNPLDQTCIHPESYDIARRFLTFVGGSADDIGTEKIQRQINEHIQRESVDKAAEKLKTTVLTLQLIIDGLSQPEGYDIRTEFDKNDFKTNIVCLEDLKVGTILTGKVENATLFGVFVDVGVGRAGLIPMRYITEDKLSKDKRRRSLGLGPGERVEVRVLSVDIRQSRIGLELLRVLK